MSHERLRFEVTAPRGRRWPDVLRDPFRAATLIGALVAIAGTLLPFLRVWTPGVGWFDVSGFARAGDGGWVLELTAVAAILIWSDRAWHSRVAAAVAGPALLAGASLIVLRDFYQDGTTYLDGLRNGGGHGTFAIGYWLAVAGSIVVLTGGAAAIWRARGRISFRLGDDATADVAAVIGGIMGAGAGFFVATAITPLLTRGATVGQSSSATVVASIVLLFVGAWAGAVAARSLARSTWTR